MGLSAGAAGGGKGYVVSAWGARVGGPWQGLHRRVCAGGYAAQDECDLPPNSAGSATNMAGSPKPKSEANSRLKLTLGRIVTFSVSVGLRLSLQA